jgi:hypothetical protein
LQPHNVQRNIGIGKFRANVEVTTTIPNDNERPVRKQREQEFSLPALEATLSAEIADECSFEAFGSTAMDLVASWKGLLLERVEVCLGRDRQESRFDVSASLKSSVVCWS